MKTSKKLYLIILILMGSTLFAQEPVMRLPEKYHIPIEPADTVRVDGRFYFYQIPEENDELDERRWWYVWSDRKDNATYTTFNGSTVKGQLGFLQPLAVLEFRGNRVRVACKNDIEIHSEIAILPAGKSDLGWIDYDNLLLWSRSLLSHPLMIEKKTMIINVFDPANPGQGHPEIYPEPHPPGNVDTRRDGETVHNYEILLVYKETEHDYLVGSRPRIFVHGETNAQAVIRGWVPKRQATPWNHRTGVEWDWETSPERIRRNNLARLWREPDHMPQADHYFQEDATTPYERVAGPFNRYAILEEQTDHQSLFGEERPVRIGYVGRVSLEGFGEIEDTLIIALHQAAFNVTERLRNINIVFVIDATLSMEIYSEPVAQALARVMDVINEREELRPPDMRKSYRFGALVFRDEPEEFVIHYSNQGNLTRDTAVINAFLKDKMHPRYNDLSRDLPESMFYGIEQAMQVFEPNPGHTNYTIIIGDAGDHQNRHGKPRTYRTAEQVIDELSAVNSNVIAYQVFHNQRTSPITGQMLPADTIYETFQTQLKHIMKETAKRIAGYDDQVDHDNIRWAETAPNTFALQNALQIGELVVPNVNDSIPMNMLEEMLTDRINVIDTITNRAIDNIIDIIISGGTSGDLTDAERAELAKTIQMLWEVIIVILGEEASPDEVFELITLMFEEGTRQYYRELYTYFEFNNLSWFRPVLLVTHDFLTQIERNINQLSEIRRHPPIQRRSALIRIWDNMIETFMGETDSEIKENITAERIHEFIVGVGVEDALWGNITYGCLRDPHCFTNQDIFDYAAEYSAAHAQVRRVMEEGTDYEGYITLSRAGFLWLPADVFP